MCRRSPRRGRYRRPASHHPRGGDRCRQGDHTIEVTAEGTALNILVKDDWGKTVQLRVPRAIVESLSGDRDITPKEILQRIDELGPGEMVTVHDGDKEVTITAEPR